MIEVESKFGPIHMGKIGYSKFSIIKIEHNEKKKDVEIAATKFNTK